MSILIVLLIILLVLSINFLFFYFLYRRFGKAFKKMFEIIISMSKTYEKPKKLKKLDHFQQELDKVNKLLDKYRKK